MHRHLAAINTTTIPVFVFFPSLASDFKEIPASSVINVFSDEI